MYGVRGPVVIVLMTVDAGNPANSGVIEMRIVPAGDPVAALAVRRKASARVIGLHDTLELRLMTRKTLGTGQ